MKKMLALLLVLALCVPFFAACDSSHQIGPDSGGNSSEEETSSTKKTEATQEETTAAETETETETETQSIYSEGLEFTSNGDGTCYVSGIGECKDTDVLIPVSSPAGDRVVGIGNAAFNFCEHLNSVVIPDGVTSIGIDAFQDCDRLTSITIPDSVTVIEAEAFESCSNICYIDIPNSVKSIGDYAFWGCDGLVSVTIPDGVTNIGAYAFTGCQSLSSVYISDSVTSIGEYAFYTCGIESITVDPENSSYMSIDGNLYTKDGKTLLQYSRYNRNESFIIPDGVTRIENGALEVSPYLKFIVIPDSVTSIGLHAISYCEFLSNVYYTGSEEDWKAINIEYQYHFYATIHYDYRPEQ